MKRLRQKAATIMASHEQQPLFSLATLLHAVSILYEKMVRQRQSLFEKGRRTVNRLPCPVISIGNITVGGTGKTPMTLHLAQLIRQLGYQTVVLSRGYKGAGEKHGMIVSDGSQIFGNVQQSGDEPYLMANLLKGIPVIVGRNRYKAGLSAVERFQPDVILLDDGFQHQQLARDINILLLDAQAPFGNSYLLPRGRLREPVSAFSRADVVVFTRCNKPRSLEQDGIAKMVGKRPVFHTNHQPVMRGVVRAGRNLGLHHLFTGQVDPTYRLDGRKVVAFSGLAHNKLFWDTIPEFGIGLVDTVGFDDHHQYQPSDIQNIARIANSVGGDGLVTTDKDLVRLPADSTFPLDLMVMGVNIDFSGDKDRWQQHIIRRLRDILK